MPFILSLGPSSGSPFFSRLDRAPYYSGRSLQIGSPATLQNQAKRYSDDVTEIVIGHKDGSRNRRSSTTDNLPNYNCQLGDRYGDAKAVGSSRSARSQGFLESNNVRIQFQNDWGVQQTSAHSAHHHRIESLNV
ncbi:hypothetical protein PCANC_07811 [Puccinia coronata f. sp. avenae]|uniref:Uncharacterized protein n=1 Tax=Puccinia coronata f. sp. avenae TaxID=200324 RepID=A0A2N5S9H7_9BASI|nr:hypothetical protein PCANC_20017 [Puccinia coronata f. sp. avenae]PLW17437.1 hypothetical protein PCASD_16369 [Puccinia coronata f. sp. avenae]PLW47536.1 hypothetical protein PCANC_07811 [Puccinia coronata f. sp. avenae]